MNKEQFKKAIRNYKIEENKWEETVRAFVYVQIALGKKAFNLFDEIPEKLIDEMALLGIKLTEVGWVTEPSEFLDPDGGVTTTPRAFLYELEFNRHRK